MKSNRIHNEGVRLTTDELCKVKANMKLLGIENKSDYMRRMILMQNEGIGVGIMYPETIIEILNSINDLKIKYGDSKEIRRLEAGVAKLWL